MSPTSDTPTRKVALEQTVGAAVRRYRQTHGLTLDALSLRAGVSGTMISKIERGKVAPSLATLDALAGAIGVPIANLFAGTVERRNVSYVREGEGMRVHRSGSTYGHIYQMIGMAHDTGLDVESHIITLAQTTGDQPLLQHPGIEFIHMLAGEMTYRVGEDVFSMSPGDSITFETEVPHGPENVILAPARFLTLIAVTKRQDSP